jgi:TRAP-type C4-dicarboxylate transport system permease small subunit
MLGALRLVERLTAATLLAITVVLVIVASSARYAGVPLIWAIEVVQALFVWLCVIAADLTLQRAGHFSVDLVANLLPRRARQALDVLNTLLAAALLGTLAYYGYLFAAFTGMRPLPITGVSSAVATGALPAGFLLMLITLTEQLMARLKGRGPTSEPAETREVM